jgi:hypothetical protein
MEFPYNLYWVLGLLSIVFVNIGSCPVCYALPLVIALVLANAGYRPQAGFLILCGFIAPLGVILAAPRLAGPIRLLISVALTTVAYFSISRRTQK